MTAWERENPDELVATEMTTDGHFLTDLTRPTAQGVPRCPGPFRLSRIVTFRLVTHTRAESLYERTAAIPASTTMLKVVVHRITRSTRRRGDSPLPHTSGPSTRDATSRGYIREG